LSGWGGVRAGAGRRRVTLAELVAERRFSAGNHRHRRALVEDELPELEDVEKLEQLRLLQDRFRSAHQRGARGYTSGLIKFFESVANGW
jgi:hypothetical protein